MALSNYEKQVLAQMEQQLRAESPDLVESLQSEQGTSRRAVTSARMLALAVVGLFLGITFLLAGVSVGYSVLGMALGAIGFVIMVASVLAPFGKPRFAARKGVAKKKDSFKQGSSSFMERQERRWDSRRD